MKYKFIILIMALVLVGGYGISLSLIEDSKSFDESRINMVYMNEVLKASEEGLDYKGNKLNDYLIIKKTDPDYEAVLNEAIKNRDIALDMDGDISGKVIFFTQFEKILNEKEEALKKAITLIFLILFCISVFYILFLKNNLYQPFKKLKTFAQSIAGGNLDIPLNMDRTNVFGPFTESFDLMREALKAARYKEEQANKSKRELIASLSHDIKTPVASIKAVSELLLTIGNDKKSKPKLKTIYEKAEQIDQLITDMFHASLEELGELKVNPTEEYSEVLRALLKNSDYENKLSIKEIPNCLISIDSLRLGQVLDNIIANSYKYANTKIEVRFFLKEEHLEMEITDDGSGMDPEELALIFNKFYRGANAQSKDGSGLGLYISKYLMKKQKGEIACSNTDTGFRVTLIMRLA